jgi:hypothetical protein
MATVREKLVARLLGWSALAALVGTRVYPDQELQQPGVMPYVTYFRVGKTSEEGFGAALGLATSPWQFNCYGASRSQTEAVADQVEAALKRWRDPSDVEIFDTIPVRLGESLIQIETPEASSSILSDIVEVTVYHRE